jgi:L,D-peptidoglycan transpeptidase YkuD (ErfK/YbiS/YcfS/YnhG family)
MTSLHLHIFKKTNSLKHQGVLQFGEHVIDCAVGRSGLIEASEKREGDGATPIGTWKIRRCFYRADTLPDGLPPMQIPAIAITRNMGWCDDSLHPDYNRLIDLPCTASHETLWRDEDGCYDIIIELGYNDTPVIAGHGSAIFFHCSKPDPQHPTQLHFTQGCVAIPKIHMLTLLPQLTPESVMEIRGLEA